MSDDFIPQKMKDYCVGKRCYGFSLLVDQPMLLFVGCHKLPHNRLQRALPSLWFREARGIKSNHRLDIDSDRPRIYSSVMKVFFYQCHLLPCLQYIYLFYGCEVCVHFLWKFRGSLCPSADCNRLIIMIFIIAIIRVSP